MSLEEELEKAFKQQEPSCHSCGWGACFYELGPWIETGRKNEFRAACVSKDDPDCYWHRGVFIYLEKERLGDGLG